MVPGCCPGPQVTPHEYPVVRPSLQATSPNEGSGPNPSMRNPSTALTGATLPGSNSITA